MKINWESVINEKKKKIVISILSNAEKTNQVLQLSIYAIQLGKNVIISSQTIGENLFAMVSQ